MKGFRSLLALAAISTMFVSGPAAAFNDSPTAPHAEQDASTVHLRDMAESTGANAPRITTVAITLEELKRAGENSPRSGVNPSAPDYEQD